jgi:hypothetical protein
LDLGEKAPSYGTVFNIVRGLPADLVTLAHEGTKAYSNTFELVHRREAVGLVLSYHVSSEDMVGLHMSQPHPG